MPSQQNKTSSQGHGGYMPPAEIRGAHRKIKVFDNFARLLFEKELLPLLRGTGNHEAALMLDQMDSLLGKFFEQGEALKFLLKKKGHKDLAKRLFNFMTGRATYVAYPLLSGQSEPD